MHSVLDQLDREDVRLHQPRYITLPLSVYEGTWTYSPLVAMHHLDRSCVIVGNFLKLLRSPTVYPSVLMEDFEASDFILEKYGQEARVPVESSGWGHGWQ